MLDRLKSWLPTIGIVILAGTFLSIIGPYQTHNLGMPGVWLYWTGLMALGWGAGAMGGAIAQRWMHDWPDIASYGFVSIFVSVPVTAAVVALQAVFGDPRSLSDLPLAFFFVWIISAAITFISWLAHRNTSASDATIAHDHEPVAGPALLSKLPPGHRGAEILALEAEDHYLRVHTSVGDTLLLMRLSDALEAVELLEGARTHRSWWVARNAVESGKRHDGRATLTLTNGLSVPVSRTYAPALREAGWL